VNLLHGSIDVVDAMLEHPTIQSISFVGSSAVARKVYAKAAASGKRVQCQGGAKNPVVVLPDCDLDMASSIIADSAFGCAGQRCLAASIAVTVGSVHDRFLDSMADRATSRVLGNGLSPEVEMGPVISAESKQRIGQIVEHSLQQGARAVVDGRNPRVSGHENGYFVAPTILSDLDAGNDILRTEVFGPVLSVLHVSSVDDAIALVNSGEYGNMACLFTSNGSAARKFRVEAEAGNIGINLGVAAPIAQFPFSGWKGSFFGDLHGQGMDAVQFFTQQKVVIERWPSEWSRKF
jgi:malonate-semialdehyde dehydrogenase (acetylating)/methylmalonate-semialdehyde dehydrogenase